MTEVHETPAEGYAPLRLLHESVVRSEEIDALGHMNVRFYGARALASTDRLLAELGVDADDFRAAVAVVHDMPCLFTRYHHEQHTGSSLEVRGGLVRVSEDGVRLYHELRNPEQDELAASFVHDIRFRVPGEDTPLLLPSSVLKELSRSISRIPEAGRPRTIDLDGAPVAPSLSEALESGLAFRLPRRVEADDCDGEGRLSAEMRPFYMWGGDPIPPEKLADGPSLIPLADGGKMGWASMETRSVMVQQPVAGMRIQAFAATVELARKTNMRRYWVFDLDTQNLLLSNEVVELALHLGQRRAIEIPAAIREEMLKNLRDDLR
jgi:acyl-CoA thioesterase FadM